jgi:hypothetical protein
MRTLGIFLLVLALHPAWGQEERRTLLDRISALLAEDTLAGPNYDTAYIKSYRDNFVVTLVNTVNSGSVNITSSNGKSLQYSTNLANNWGIGLDYKWFTFEYTTYIPGLSSSDPTKGVTDHFNLGFGITGRKWWFRNFIARYNGYYVEDPTAIDTAWDPGEAYPVRNDLGSFTYLASFNYGFNYRRYSHNAFLWQLERQKRSQGTWVAGVTFWYNSLSSDSSLVPAYIRADFPDAANFNQVNRIILSLNGGYSYTLALWKKGFLSGLLVPGITMQRQVFFFPDGLANKDTDWGLGLMAEFRVALGYNGDTWYTSLSYGNYVAAGNVSPDVTIGSGSGVVRFAVGVRLPGLNNPFLKKFGL